MTAVDPSGSGSVDSVLGTIRVDRASPVPLYFQFAKALEDAILAGTLPPGSLLDNELMLADRFGLSRPTIRQALQQLVDQGLVVRRRGVGTRVVQPKVRRPLGLTSLFDDLTRDGQQPTTTVLACDVEPCDAEVAAALALPEGSPVVHLVRLRSAGDLPIARMTNFLPAGRVTISPAQIEAGGLYELIRRAGILLHAATQSIGARTATAAEARLLQESRGAAVLTMQRTAYDDQGVPVEHGNHIYAASRYAFQAELLTP